MRDYGLDVIAERNRERIGIQVKKYLDANRPVNPRVVMEAYGAAAYADCDRAVIATDGRVLSTASTVASKLGVEIRHVPADPAADSDAIATSTVGLDFDDVWKLHIIPLRGQTLFRSNGQTNQILDVSEQGIVRRTSRDTVQKIGIDIFRWAIDRILAGETVTRDDINAHCLERASSGVMLILRQVSVFEVTTEDRKEAIRLNASAVNAASLR